MTFLWWLLHVCICKFITSNLWKTEALMGWAKMEDEIVHSCNKICCIQKRFACFLSPCWSHMENNNYVVVQTAALDGVAAVKANESSCYYWLMLSDDHQCKHFNRQRISLISLINGGHRQAKLKLLIYFGQIICPLINQKCRISARCISYFLFSLLLSNCKTQ